MKDSSRIEASLLAAQEDVSRIFQGYEVPQEYRTRLTAYIQCWYLDQGLEHDACAGRAGAPRKPGGFQAAA
jgi:hypothetical protein